MSRATNRRTNDKKLKTQSMLIEQTQKEQMITCGVYEKISKVVVGAKKEWRKNKRFIEEQLDEISEYKDNEYPPDNSNLVSLTEQNSKIAKYFAWYRIHAFFEKKYTIFNEIKLKNQIIRNRGYVYLIDALNTLSAQPGLVLRLFERKKSTREGIYAVWVNIDGRWQQEIIDDHVPIVSDHDGKNQFFFTNPNPKDKEMWYMLLEKAMAKAYGGYKNLFNGFENYAVRDLTGAPHMIYDIPPVPIGRAIKQREADHMNDFWEIIYKGLKKGYIMSMVPRLPTQTEKIANRNLKIPNKNYYLSNGLYSGHNYAVITAKEVRDSKGNLQRIVKMRNPFINEVWQGDWSYNSSLWTSQLKKSLNFDPENNGYGDFWISIRDIMGYFEVLNTYKVIPGYTYTSIDVPAEDRRIIRTFIKIVVPETGKYTFSVDQKDLRNWPYNGMTYCPVKLSLGKIEKDNFQLLSHTSSKKLRNTFIRKLIEKGEYYLLIEKSNRDQNIALAQQNPESFKELNSFVVSCYGPKTCGMNLVDDLRKNYAVYDYVCYFGWKWYSQQRIGQKVSEFKVNFYDGSWNKMSLYLLNIPDLIIYAFKNDHNFGVELTATIGGLPGREILGPEGKKSYEQKFSMNAGETDVFLFRNTRDDNTTLTKENNKFQMKSVVGIKYIGVKENPPTFQQFYEFLKKIDPKIRKCEIEKDPVLYEKIGLFDIQNGMRKIRFEQDDVNQVKVIKMTKPMKLEQYEDLVDANDLIQRERSLHDQNEKIRAKSQPLRKHKPGEKIVERVRLEDFLKEKAEQEPEKLEEIKKHIKPETLEALKQQAPKEEPTLQQSQFNDNSNLSSPFQQSPVQNPSPKTDKIDHQQNLKSLEKYVNSVTQIDDNKLAKVLTLQKEELLHISEEELKQLLKYFGIQAFITIYQVDEIFLNKIVQKIEGKIPQEKEQFTSRSSRMPVSSENRTGVAAVKVGDTQSVQRHVPSKSVGRAEMAPRQSQKRGYQDRHVVEYPDLLKPTNTTINDPIIASQQENLSEMILQQKQTQDIRASQYSSYQPNQGPASSYGYSRNIEGERKSYMDNQSGENSRYGGPASSKFSQNNGGYSQKLTPSMDRIENLKSNKTFAEGQISDKIRQRLNEIRDIKERLSQQVSNVSQTHSKSGTPNSKRGLKYQILNNLPQQQENQTYYGNENLHNSKKQRMENEVSNGVNDSNLSQIDFRKKNSNEILRSSGYNEFRTEVKKNPNERYFTQTTYQSETKTRNVEITNNNETRRYQELQTKIEQKRKQRHEYGFDQTQNSNNNNNFIQQNTQTNPKQNELIKSLEAEKLKELREQEELLRLVEEHKKAEARRQEEQRKMEEERKRKEEQRIIDEERKRQQELIRQEQARLAEEERRREELERRNIEEQEKMIMEKIRMENEEIQRQHELQQSQIREMEIQRRNEMISKHSNYNSAGVTPLNNNFHLKEEESVFKSKYEKSNMRNSELKKPQNYRNIKGPGRKTMGDPISHQNIHNNLLNAVERNTHQSPDHTEMPLKKQRRPSHTNNIPQLDHYDPTVDRFNRLKKTLQQKRMLAENNAIPYHNKIGRKTSITESNYTHKSLDPNSRINTDREQFTIRDMNPSRPQTGIQNITQNFENRPLTSDSKNLLSNLKEHDHSAMNRIQNVLSNNEFRKSRALKFHQNQSQQMISANQRPQTGRSRQFSPQPDLRESKNLAQVSNNRAPFRNKRARNTTNPHLFSKSDVNLNGIHLNSLKDSRRRERLGSHGLQPEMNNVRKSGHQNLLLAQNNQFVHQSPQPQNNGLQLNHNSQNVQAIPVHNQNFNRNAITERSASSRQLGLTQTNQPQPQHVQQPVHQNHHPLKQSHYLQAQQQQQPHFSPTPSRSNQYQHQVPQHQLRSSADFQQHNSPDPFRNANNRQFFAPAPEPQQMVQPNNYNQRPQTSQSQIQNFNNTMNMSNVNPINQGFNPNMNMGNHQFQGHFNQNGGGGFRPQSPNPGYAQNLNMRDSVNTQKRLAYGNEQRRPKSSRGDGGGFLSGLFG